MNERKKENNNQLNQSERPTDQSTNQSTDRSENDSRIMIQFANEIVHNSHILRSNFENFKNSTEKERKREGDRTFIPNYRSNQLSHDKCCVCQVWQSNQNRFS